MDLGKLLADVLTLIVSFGVLPVAVAVPGVTLIKDVVDGINKSKESGKENSKAEGNGNG